MVGWANPFFTSLNICLSYQILKAGGLKDENRIVFMADDVANNPTNPSPSIIMNKPHGPNVYPGVPRCGFIFSLINQIQSMF